MSMAISHKEMEASAAPPAVRARRMAARAGRERRRASAVSQSSTYLSRRITGGLGYGRMTWYVSGASMRRTSSRDLSKMHAK